jgi:hypothetical protein
MISLRHHLVFASLRPFLRISFHLAFRYRAIPAPRLERGQPAFILANHNCAWDPFFIAISFKRAIYYIASDHIFRLGFISSIIRFLVDPIPIVKSQIDLRTLRQVRLVIKEGGIVGLFPEGNRSFNGLLGWIPPATGKLVKQLGCPLLLFKIHGGYLSTPRWSRYSRKGKMCGEVVRTLAPQEIAALTPDEINHLIRDTLATDAYSEQRSEAVLFIGKRLAEYLERALFICPRCRAMATLYSQADYFTCTCGLRVKYGQTGFFEPIDEWSKQQAQQGSFLDSVAAWDIWQRQTLIAKVDEPGAIDWHGSQAIFTDENEQLFNCERARRSTPIDQGSLVLYSDRLVFQGQHKQHHFPLAEIDRMVVHGPQTLQFNTRGGLFLEVHSKKSRSAYKYVLLFHLLEQKRQGEPHGFFGI